VGEAFLTPSPFERVADAADEAGDAAAEDAAS